MTAGVHPFFLDLGARGRRFCIHHVPDGRARRCIVYVHPFAEEMNKSRRMVAECARALARAGHSVLQMDLLGCGDSDGDLGDATWEDWILDSMSAAQWVQQSHSARLTFWGLRSGALIAGEAASRLGQVADFMLWQPAVRGDPLLQQFLRLKVAAGLKDADGGRRDSTAELRAALTSGRSVEIAGYRLSPGLSAGLTAASLAPPASPGTVTWFELSTRPEPTLLPASTTVIGRWRDAGYRVDARVVPGPAFWSTVEIDMAPALVEATVSALAMSGPETGNPT